MGGLQDKMEIFGVHPIIYVFYAFLRCSFEAVTETSSNPFTIRCIYDNGNLNLILRVWAFPKVGLGEFSMQERCLNSIIRRLLIILFSFISISQCLMNKKRIKISRIFSNRKN